MSDPEKIVCKPTPWFLLRAAVMVVMFSVFAVLFFRDGSIGYRRQNASFYLRKAFISADEEFKAKGVNQSPETWRAHAASQEVALPDGSLLPPDVQPGMKWPAVLQDAEQLKAHQWTDLWRDYSKERKIDFEVPHDAYTADKIQAQWTVFWICLALALVAAFFLIRTLLRSIAVDGEALYPQNGRRIPFPELKRLDLRKWETKGLAFADYEGPSGSGRVRIDGLTYGGFNKEQGEPAEKLMQRLRARFSGELVEYVTVEPGEVDSSAQPD